MKDNFVELLAIVAWVLASVFALLVLSIFDMEIFWVVLMIVSIACLIGLPAIGGKKK